MKQRVAIIGAVAIAMLLGACARPGASAGSLTAATQPTTAPGQPAAEVPLASGTSAAGCPGAVVGCVAAVKDPALAPGRAHAPNNIAMATAPMIATRCFISDLCCKL